MADIEQKEIGEELQSARIDKGLTLDDVQAQTKIQKRYLQAIENNQFDQLPGKFYERAFTRQYAAVVGLDIDDLLEQRDLSTTDSDTSNLEQVHVDEDNVAKIDMHRVDNAQKDKIRNVMPKVIIGIVVLVFAIIIWIFVANFAGHSKSSTKSSHVSVSSSSVSKSSSSEESSSEKSEKDSSKSNIKTDIGVPTVTGNITTFSAKVPVNASRKLILNSKNGDSWVLVKTNTGVVLYSGTIKNGTNQKFDLNKDIVSVNIQTGNANNLKIQFNDNDLNLNNTALTWRALINIIQK